MVVQILLCQHCGSDRIVRNGRAPNGKQRFLCRTCGRQCRRNPSSRGYSEAERDQILRAYQERSRVLGFQRTFGVAPATVAKWLKKVQSLLPRNATVVEPPQDSGGEPVFELDELWSYVGQKAWLWIAFARHSRKNRGLALDNRTEATTRQLWDRLPASYREAQVYTDDG